MSDTTVRLESHSAQMLLVNGRRVVVASEPEVSGERFRMVPTLLRTAGGHDAALTPAEESAARAFWTETHGAWKAIPQADPDAESLYG